MGNIDTLQRVLKETDDIKAALKESHGALLGAELDAWWGFCQQVGAPRTTLVRLIMRHGRLLAQHTPQQAHGMVALLKTFGMQDDVIRTKVLRDFPQLLVLDLDTQVLPALDVMRRLFARHQAAADGSSAEGAAGAHSTSSSATSAAGAEAGHAWDNNGEQHLQPTRYDLYPGEADEAESEGEQEDAVGRLYGEQQGLDGAGWDPYAMGDGASSSGAGVYSTKVQQHLAACYHSSSSSQASAQSVEEQVHQRIRGAAEAEGVVTSTLVAAMGAARYALGRTQLQRSLTASVEDAGGDGFESGSSRSATTTRARGRPKTPKVAPAAESAASGSPPAIRRRRRFKQGQAGSESYLPHPDMAPAEKAFRMLVCNYPELLLYLLDNGVAAQVDKKVAALRDAGLGAVDVGMAILTCPGFFQVDVQRTLVPKLRVLQAAGIRGAELRGLLVACPNVLQVSRAQLQRNLRFLTTVVGASVSDILDTPQVLALSVHRELGPAFAYLRTAFPAASTHPSTTTPLYTDDLHGPVSGTQSAADALDASSSSKALSGSAVGSAWAALCNKAGRLRLGVVIGMAFGADVMVGDMKRETAGLERVPEWYNDTAYARCAREWQAGPGRGWQ